MVRQLLNFVPVNFKSSLRPKTDALAMFVLCNC